MIRKDKMTFFKRLRAFLVATLVVGTLGLTAFAGTADAAYTLNLAGRPINSPTDGPDNDGLNHCQGTAYARINGSMALLIPEHCANGAPGDPVYADDGQYLGYYGLNGKGCLSSCAIPGTGVNELDITYIMLSAGNWPSNRNMIYRGVNGTLPFAWTITRNPPADLGCAGLYAHMNQTVAENFQKTHATTDWFTTGASWDYGTYGTYCRIQTKVSQHMCNWPNWCRDSGSSMLLDEPGYVNTVLGTTVAWWDLAGHWLVFVPMYDQINALNTYWLSHGSGVGAWLCQTASC